MSKNRTKKKERVNEESKDHKYDDNEGFNYENQFIKTTQISEGINENDHQYEEQGIKINLSKIEERPTDEEESILSSIITIKENRLNRKYDCLKKLLKFRNQLYYYFYKWRKKINNSSGKKRLKKIKKKKKLLNTKFNLGDNFIITEELSNEDENKSKKKLYHSMILNSKSPNSKRIRSNLKCIIENINKKYIKNYFNKWKQSNNMIFIRRSDKLIKSEKKKNKNIFEDDNDIKDNFYYNNSGGGIKRKELKIAKNENIISNFNREVRKTFRISQSNNNIFLKFEDNEKDVNNKTNNYQRNKSLNKKENNRENKKNKDNECSSDKSNEIEGKKSKKLDRSDDRLDKKKAHKKKKSTKKIKKNKLKKIIEKINDHKLLRYFFDKWLYNYEYKSNNYYELITKKIEDILFEDEKNNNSSNQEEVVIPLYLANNQYFNGNYNFGKINSAIIPNKTKTFLDDKGDDKKDSNMSEEEIVFKDKIFKRIKKNDRNDKNNYSLNNVKKRIGEVPDKENIQKNKTSKDINKYDIEKKNDNNNKFFKNNTLKNKPVSIIIKENEVPKIIKKRNNNENHNGFKINDNFIRQNYNNTSESDDNDNDIESESNKDNNIKLIFNNTVNNFSNERKKQREEMKLSLINNSSDIKQYNTLDSINNYSEQKEISEEIKNSNKKQKKLIRRYKKGFHLLRRVLKSRKKRNKNKFNSDAKKKLYFNLWISKSFPEGIDVHRKQKVLSNSNKKRLNSIERKADTNKEKNNIKIKEKLLKLIDVVTNYINRNKIIYLNQKDDLSKINYCFYLWCRNVFGDITETHSTITEENSFVDINKKIINKNLINILNDSKYNNKNNSDRKKNTNKLYSVLKKIILHLNEKKLKRLYFTKWKELFPLVKSITTPYSKPRLSTPNKSDNKTDNTNINEMKKSPNNNINENKAIIKENKPESKNKGEIIKEKIKEIIIINTDIKKNDKNNEEESTVRTDGKLKSSSHRDDNEEEEEDKGDMEEEEEDDEIMSFTNKKHNKDLDKKIKSLKIKNRLYNILEKIDNKKKIFFCFNHWRNYVASIKKKEIKKDDVSQRKILLSNIIKHFSPTNDLINEIGNNNKKKKKYHKRKNSGHAIEDNFLRFKAKKKRIIVKNELNDRKRSKTLLPHQVGAIGVNTDDSIYDNDYDNTSGDIFLNNSNLKHSATMNIINIKPDNPKSTDVNKSEEGDLHKYNFNKINNLKTLNIKDNKNKMKIAFIEKEKEKGKKLVKDICDMSQKNIDIINKNVDITKNNSNINLLNNEFKDKYISLLKKNYEIMASYQIFYLYTLFTERVDYYKLKYVFNKLKKEKI
jgi:hypothetical protein